MLHIFIANWHMQGQQGGPLEKATEKAKETEKYEKSQLIK